MSSELAIRIRGLGKCYPIFDKPQDRLKQMLARGRRKYFREFWAVKDVDLDVYRGETVGIIGRNGAGKSTLLQLICGTIAPTRGEIEVSGKVAAILELGSGFNPEFTGRENVYLNGTILGLSREELDTRFDEIAAFADIGGFVEQPVKTYSSGMFMRLAFAVIAHVDADILVIDEALAVGDAFFTQKCMRFLRKFQEVGTVLFVSHDTGAVTNLCDRAVWLNGGIIEADDDAKEVCEQYFMARYLEETGVKENKKAKSAKQLQTQEEVVKKPIAKTFESRYSKIATPRLAQIIETFGFNCDSAEFGAGDATILSVELVDKSGAPLTWIEGGEDVEVIVHAVCNKGLDSPIIGFHVKDRLGQPLFGDNTFLAYQSSLIRALAGDRLEARFVFSLPLLASGEYSVCAAIASGTLLSHVQQHWIHDALLFTVHASSVNGVLVGIPMKTVSLSRIEPL